MKSSSSNPFLSSLNIDAGKRVVSALMDWFIMAGIAIPFSIPYMISTFDDINYEKPGGILWYIALMGFALFFCKDCIYGQSIGKRIMRLQVVNNTTGQIANPLRCFVRDIFMILWPIEGLITLISPQRRLGDFVAGTKVVLFDPELEKPEINKVQIVVCLALSYTSMLILIPLFSR